MRSPTTLVLTGVAILALFVGYFASGTTVVENPSPSFAQATTTGLAVMPDVELPPVVLPNLIATTTATSTPSKPKPAKVIKSTPATATPVAPPAIIATPAGDLSSSATEIRAALVNIICIAPVSSGVQSISGSGVIIDPRGIILTNAHIGQYFLLRDRGVRCTIRTGSPAKDTYTASLIFISPAWISTNSHAITEAQPMGTGEHDIALVAVTGSTPGASLPSSFSFAPLAQDTPAVTTPVVIGSYAAQFLESSAIVSSLYPTIVYGSIQDVFTFATNSIDLVSLGGSAAAQEGSSGGGVVDALGNLIATITTSTTAGDTASRELNAITAAYIRRDYVAETSTTISTLLADSPSLMISNFAPQIAGLEAQITANLH